MLALAEPLISEAGVPASTIVEASWLYMDAVDRLSALSEAATVAARLARLSSVFEALVAATRTRTSELSADDLVPLLTLTIVCARLDDFGFEGWLLEALHPPVLSFGREAYCACTVQVALAFLTEVQLPQLTPSAAVVGAAS